MNFFFVRQASAQIVIKERVEIDPTTITIPNGPAYNFDSTICNRFEDETEILVTDGDDSTYAVWYGNCADIGFGGYHDCIHFEINDSWIVTIEEGFEYVRPRTSYLYCDGPYSDEGDNFYVDYNYCFHLVFDKQEPETIAQVKIKFAYGTKVAHYTFDVYRPFFHLTPVDSFEVMEYGDYILVDNFKVLNQCDTYWPWLPDTVSIVQEIVQGSEYGQLWNSFTNEYGTSFTGTDIYLVANGIKPAQDAEILIRLSTTDPDIDPLNIVYIVKSVDLEITVLPPAIAAGDTASIIIQKKYLDGTIADFDEWQTFEIAKIEGCALGDILVDGETGAYFSDVYQPIQFVVDSLAEDGTVVLKIGVLKYPSFATRPVVLNNTPPVQTEQSQTKTNNNSSENTISENQTNPPSDNPLLSCALEPVESVLNEDVGVVVGDECDDYSCSEVIIKPSFTFESFPNGTFNADPCSTEQAKRTYVVDGVTSVIWSEVNYLEYLKTENITACYEPTLDRWKFGTTKPLFPYFKVIMDVCLTNITNNGFRPLEDIADISDPVKWNDPNVCAAKKDLEGNRTYPSKVRPGGYIFLEVTMAHEMAHGQDFQWVIDSLQSAFLYPTLDLFEVNCGNYDVLNRRAKSKEEAKSVFLSEYQKIIMGETANGVIIKKGFEQKLFDGYKNHIKQDFIVNGIIVDHENYINSFPIVTNTIDVILSEFENIWNCN